jgi:hypothetical protein
MREQHATHGMGKSGELGPPITLRLRNVKFGIEQVGHAIEQVALARDVTVQGHRRHADPVGEAAQGDCVGATLISQCEPGA